MAARTNCRCREGASRVDRLGEDRNSLPGGERRSTLARRRDGVGPMQRETDMFLRLRQIALVARELNSTESLITRALGLDVCFRDVGVAKYGLHNALWGLGGTFLEVV